MKLSIDVIESSDASTLYILDTCSEYGAISQNVTYISKSDISKVEITFKHYKHTIQQIGDVSDWITEDKVLTVIPNVSGNTSLLYKITASEVFGTSNTIFPEGVYFIQYKLFTNTNKALPSNNNVFVHGEVLFAQTQKYYDQIMLRLSTDLTLDTTNSDFYQYLSMFNTKFMAFKIAINAGNLKQIRANLAYLQRLVQAYPNSNDTRVL